MEAYLERVRDAMAIHPREMSKRQYIEALEELAADIDGMLEAAREELARDEATL